MIDDEQRTRHVVGEIIRTPDGKASFRYLNDTEDYHQAQEEGFQGYPAFRLHRTEHGINVIEAFTCRLPSKKRGDYQDYLFAHSLPVDFAGSDFSLLAHTGAKLPGDGFEIIPDLSGVLPPYDLIIETAGTRHQSGLNLDVVLPDDPVALVHEPANKFDVCAIEVIHSVAGRLGYVPRPYCGAFQSLISTGRLTARIHKLNGRPERRLVYLLVSVR